MIVAAADLVGEANQTRLSAVDVVVRAGVTIREFAAGFNGLEDCLLAAFDEGLARVGRRVAESSASIATAVGRIEAGLAALLAFLDEEPGWGRLLLLELPVAARPRRERAVAAVGRALSDWQLEAGSDEDTALPEIQAARLAAEVLGIIRAKMIAGTGQPLLALTPSLMAAMIEPRLAGQDAGEAADLAVAQARHLTPQSVRSTRAGRVLRAVAAVPRSSNRKIAHAAGLADNGSVFRVIRHLRDEGLIRNVGSGIGQGRPNAWVVSEAGERAIEAVAGARRSGKARPVSGSCSKTGFPPL